MPSSEPSTPLVRRVSTGQPAPTGSRAEWARLVEQCQSLVNTATAAQDVAITRLAALEEEWPRTARPERRIGQPGTLPSTLPTSSREPSASPKSMRSGGCRSRSGLSQTATGPTASRARLPGCRPSTRRWPQDDSTPTAQASSPKSWRRTAGWAVVGTLHASLGVDTAVQLRRRCRRAIASISPDLLRQRARRAREECGLRRWAEEPGVDRWEGTFPSEDAAEGGPPSTPSPSGTSPRAGARGSRRPGPSRLMDLIRARTTVDVQLVVTVPATEVEQAGHEHQQGRPARRPMDPRAHGPIGDTTDSQAARGEPEDQFAHLPGAVTPGDRAALTDAATLDDLAPPGDAEPSLDPVSSAEDARLSARAARDVCVAADERARLTPPPTTPGPPSHRASAMAADDLIEVIGPFAGEPMLVRRRWVTDIRVGARVRSAACHAVSGALLDDDGPDSAAYRPGARIARLVRLRDGRCRFPGCSVAARFCDLDHVQPWPAGPTSAANLMCLCRRHHRGHAAARVERAAGPRWAGDVVRPHGSGATHPRPGPPALRWCCPRQRVLVGPRVRVVPART